MRLAKYALLMLLIVLTSTSVLGLQVVINSEDWRDVYSGMHYASMNGLTSNFVVDSVQGAGLVNRLESDNDVLLITGDTQAMPGFKTLLRSKGYFIEEIRSRRPTLTNQDLALETESVNVIVIDDAYGYNAVSVSTYANVWNASVLFADIGIRDIIDEKNPESILLFGHIPRDVYEELEDLNPEIINNQDRFEDNFELVKKFAEFGKTDALLLSNGEFLERQLISDDDPILFTGRQQVPQDVIDFINGNEFRLATLVGNSLAPNARTIKDETGISIFIKFARGNNQQQFGLDLFNLPRYNPLIVLAQAEYNPSEQQLLVTYQNPGEIATYISASFTSEFGSYEDDEPVFVEAGTHKTITYDMPNPGDSISYLLLYGASPSSLDLLLQGVIDVVSVEIDDESEILIADAAYDSGKQEFVVEVQNTGSVDTFVLIEIDDVRIGPENIRLASEVTNILVGSSASISLPADLSELDLSRNDEISIEAFYGEREFSLIKFEKSTFPFKIIESGFPIYWVGLAVIVALILMWFVGRKKKEKPKDISYYQGLNRFQ